MDKDLEYTLATIKRLASKGHPFFRPQGTDDHYVFLTPPIVYDIDAKDQREVLDTFGPPLTQLGLENVTEVSDPLSRLYTGEEQRFRTLQGVQRTFVYLSGGTGASYTKIRSDKTREEHYVGWSTRDRRGRSPKEISPQKHVISATIVVVHVDPKVSTFTSAFLSGLPLCEQVRIKLFEDLTKDHPLFPDTQYQTFIKPFRDVGNWRLCDYKTVPPMDHEDQAESIQNPVYSE